MGSAFEQIQNPKSLVIPLSLGYMIIPVKYFILIFKTKAAQTESYFSNFNTTG
jgi:hypothetical protein